VAGLNKIVLIGTILSNPEAKFSVEGTPITKFWVDINGGFNQPSGKIEVVCWQKLAEISGSLTKGLNILVEGQLRIRSYEDQSGSRKWVTEITATNIVKLAGGGQEVVAQVSADKEASDSEIEEIEPLPEDDLPF